ncbi:putative Tetratricopeptide repeat protein 27 [Paratrimastix pyriformis]|uniref:Tetratricopeptide repeat protein 27 n=1 Tax=Paratrimastix pyriformis TaxID=342808 RepID=A0ABQ8UQM0_9EUKA|nr:putative Tetratricopeptide repeat protein 27 [Paratrimastix pyriformis]
MAYRTALELSLVALSKKAFDHLTAQQTDSALNELFTNVLECRYGQVLNSPQLASFWAHAHTPSEVKEAVPLFIGGTLGKDPAVPGAENSYEQRLDAQYQLLAAGVMSFLAFCQAAWTGPDPADLPPPDESQSGVIMDYLMADGEPVEYHRIPQLHWLAVARAILVESAPHLSACKYLPWWTLRVLAFQQRILANPTQTLRKACDAQVALLMGLLKENQATFEEALIPDTDRALLASGYLECTLVYIFFKEPKKAKEMMEQTLKTNAMRLALTGQLGTRTAWQTEKKAQLVARVYTSLPEPTATATATAAPSNAAPSAEAAASGAGGPVVPREATDTEPDVLSRPALESEDPDEAAPAPAGRDAEVVYRRRRSPLAALEQAIVLAQAENVRTKGPRHDLINEESLAYVDCVHAAPVSWTVLVDQFADRAPHPRERLQHLFAVMYPPRPAIFNLHLRGQNIGSAATALALFERLEMWDCMIECHRAMAQVEQALALTRERLGLKPDPKLLVVLGDLTNTAEPFLEAWELSKCHYSPAMRRLGARHLKNAEWAQAVECFGKALALNPLFPEAWFSVGVAHLHLSQWDLAGAAFRRCLAIDHDNAGAWANLANCYLKLKEKDKAHLALHEALKCDYEDWKLWQNYLYVSMDVGQLGPAIEAFRRLVDLRRDEKAVDVECLEMIVNLYADQRKLIPREAPLAAPAATATPSDEPAPPQEGPSPAAAEALLDEGAPQVSPHGYVMTPRELQRLERQLGDLLEHITEVVNSADISRLKARYQVAYGDHARAYENMMARVRYAQTLARWMSEEGPFTAAVDTLLDLGRFVLGEMSPEARAATRAVHAVHLNVRSSVKRTENTFFQHPKFAELTKLAEHLKRADV